MAKEKPPAQERRAQLDPVKLEEMMAIVIQNQDAYDSVVDLLTVKHVRHISEGFGILWRQVRSYHERHNELPAKGSLIADLHNAIAQNPNGLTDEEKTELDDFLDYAYDPVKHGKDITKSKAHVRAARDTCRQYLEEGTLHDLCDISIKDGTVPLDIPSLLQRTQAEIEAIAALSAGDLEKPFPKGWDTREHVKLFSTGCPSLDALTGGGWCGSEVLLFMGPYGSCKTTLVVDSCANLIKYAAQKFIESQTLSHSEASPRPVVVLIFTEGETQDYRLRLLSNLAKIPWKRLMDMRSMDELCKKKNVGCTDATKYELKEFALQKAAGGEGFFPEFERVKRATDLCNQFLVLLDCTDSEDNPHPVGGGGIPELANIVNSHFRKNPNTYPLAFWLDHASALVDRMADAGGSDFDKTMHLVLKRIPKQCKDKLAKKWNAPIGIIHQLSGKANSKSILAELSHSDAAGSKQFGEYADFAVTTNKPNDEQLARMTSTKHRREPPASTRIVHVDGTFQRLMDVTADFVLDSGRIIAKRDFEKVFGLNNQARGASSSKPEHGLEIG